MVAQEEMHYWVGFRVKDGARAVVLLGPYGTNEQALRDRDRNKAIDVDLTAPFVASDKEEAMRRAEWEFGLRSSPD